MKIILLGLNHKTAPLEIREKLSCAAPEGTSPLREIMRIDGIREAFYLSTCNRTEVFFRVDDAPEEALDRLKTLIRKRGNFRPEEMDRHFYLYFDEQAIRHLFRVASSLDSMVMGEPQILGQVKESYREAVDNDATGILLNKILHHTFRVAKRVRTETGIASHAVSVSYTAVELAKKIFGNLAGKTVLLVGAGEMSELAARHLMQNGAGRILVANRTFERSLQLADLFKGEAIRFDDVEQRLREADIVISSTGAPGYIISKDRVAAALHRRKNRLLFLIDIAVPRDIDPEAARLDNVYLYNVDDLQDIVDENRNIRRKEAEKAEAIVEEEVGRYREWYNTLEVVPTIVSLKEKTAGIIRGELERSSSWLQDLREDERNHVEILLSSVVNKILHDPIVGLKEKTIDRNAKPYIAAVKHLFNLEDEPSKKRSE
ncbi:MAG TPA: glutamyl-tRNA reductase [Syntrophales bacterium]|jgi:glutamyl-tRNA reductase|nr:glutamyl-tRNA reductase [Syntrophales bacterium]HQA82080.1 glutamyl-tRNA reductase [Syntrophales bacterium]